MQVPVIAVRSARMRWAIAGAIVVLAAGPAAADDSFHPVDSTLKMLDLKTDAGAMPDFVNQTRDSAGKDFIPVGAKPPTRTVKPKSQADVKALTADLDAARAAQLAGKRPKPVVTGSESKSATVRTTKR